MTTGAAPASFPARSANMLPMASTRSARPASRHQSAKRSRPSRSAGVSVTRRTPPFGVAPIFARSMSEDQSRWASMLGLDIAPILEPPLEQRADARIRAGVGEADHAVELQLPFGRHALRPERGQLADLPTSV